MLYHLLATLLPPPCFQATNLVFREASNPPTDKRKTLTSAVASLILPGEQYKNVSSISLIFLYGSFLPFSLKIFIKDLVKPLALASYPKVTKAEKSFPNANNHLCG